MTSCLPRSSSVRSSTVLPYSASFVVLLDEINDISRAASQFDTRVLYGLPEKASTYSLAGLTPSCASISFPSSLEKIKWLRLVLWASVSTSSRTFSTAIPRLTC